MPPSQNYGTSVLRVSWATYECKEGGSWADPTVLGKKVGGVPQVAADAYKALDQALTVTGYKPPEKCQSVWSYVCRNIAGSDNRSLHSYGVAIDIDPAHNPQGHVPPYSGWLSEAQVTAVMSILNPQGGRVWYWGGYWSFLPDLMHFQLDQPPDRVAVNWSTVAGSTTTAPSQPDGGSSEGIVTDKEEGMILTQGASGALVRSYQRALNTWAKANQVKGWKVLDITGSYDQTTTKAVKQVQASWDLPQSGDIDGLTGARLSQYDPPQF